MRSPVVAAVHGSAAGAGFSLVCAVDFVIAAESAKFTMAYTKAGLTPDGSSTFFLPRIVGFRRAMEFAILNPVLSAKQALALGIVTRVVPDAELARAGDRIRRGTRDRSDARLRGVKRLLIDSAMAPASKSRWAARPRRFARSRGPRTRAKASRRSSTSAAQIHRRIMRSVNRCAVIRDGLIALPAALAPIEGGGSVNPFWSHDGIHETRQNRYDGFAHLPRMHELRRQEVARLGAHFG